MIAETSVARLYGRERELAMLGELVTRVGEPGGSLVVRGEAGTGKSALLSETGRLARERGLVVLKTTGVESEAHLPFAGLHQLLRPILAEIDALPGPQRAAISAAFGRSDEAAPDIFLIALAALDLLVEVSGGSPLLLVVDDAHWLDRPSCDVLAFVARRVELEPIALLFAVRDGFDDPFEAADLPELRVEGLDDARALELLGANAPDLAPDVRKRLLGAAAGNPLALVELSAALTPEQLGGTDVLPDLLPLTARLQRAFAVRVSGLPGATRTFLRVAAVDHGGVVAEVLHAAVRSRAPSWPFHRARLLLAYGVWLRRRRRVAESRAPVRAAREAYRIFPKLGITSRGQLGGVRGRLVVES